MQLITYSEGKLMQDAFVYKNYVFKLRNFDFNVQNACCPEFWGTYHSIHEKNFNKIPFAAYLFACRLKILILFYK